jgi:hypothetical protein
MISSAERILINRVSMLVVQAELYEQKFVQQDGIANNDQWRSYLRALNSITRMLSVLGLHKRARDVTPPSVDSYLQQEAAE